MCRGSRNSEVISGRRWHVNKTCLNPNIVRKLQMLTWMLWKDKRHPSFIMKYCPIQCEHWLYILPSSRHKAPSWVDRLRFIYTPLSTTSYCVWQWSDYPLRCVAMAAVTQARGTNTQDWHRQTWLHFLDRFEPLDIEFLGLPLQLSTVYTGTMCWLAHTHIH